MTAEESWPFAGERAVGRRGDLLVLEATAPDGRPVTITRLAPGSSAELDERFRAAVAAVAERAGEHGYPSVAWRDLDTLMPWAATYDDPAHQGADLIERVLADGLAALGAGDARDGATSAPDGDPGSGELDETAPIASGRRRVARTRMMAAVVGGAVAVVLVVVGATVGLVGARRGAEPSATRYTFAPTTLPSDNSTGGPGPTATPDDLPTLRHVKPRSVYGPTWKRDDDTYLMAFSQLTWAFRTPRGMDCLIANESKLATKVTCINLLSIPKGARGITIVDRRCKAPHCTKAERKAFERDPSGETVHWKVKDKTTKYRVERFTRGDKRRYFGFHLSHYYWHGRVRRHVSVYGEAPVGHPAKQIQKTINDIRTQSG